MELLASQQVAGGREEHGEVVSADLLECHTLIIEREPCSGLELIVSEVA